MAKVSNTERHRCLGGDLLNRDAGNIAVAVSSSSSRPLRIPRDRNSMLARTVSVNKIEDWNFKMQIKKLELLQDGSAKLAPNIEKATAEPEQQPVTVSDALLGTDPPLEKAHPGLQPALVFAAYPLAFIVIISCIAVYYMITQSNPTADEAYPNAPASVGSSQR